MNRRRIPQIVVLLFIASLLCTWAVTRDWTSTLQLRRQAEAALRRGDFAGAEQLAGRLMVRSGQRPVGLLIAGEAIARLGRPDEAVALLAQIVSADRNLAVAGHFARGQILLTKLLRLEEAELAFRSALEIEPRNADALEQMSYILGLEGRSWEAVPYRIELLRQGQFKAPLLLLLALGNSAEENPEEIARFAKAGSAPPVLCAQAREAMRKNETVRAQQLLRRAVAANQGLIQAQAWLGTILVDEGAETEISAWHSNLPASAAAHPDIWYVRGNWARRRSAPAQAARCFWEAVRIDPNHQQAHYHLAQALIALGKPEAARPFLERARLLAELIVAGKTLQLSGNPEAIRSAARLSETLGLVWEHRGWNRILAQQSLFFDSHSSGAEVPGELSDLVNRTDPARLIDWNREPSEYSLPDWMEHTTELQDRAPVSVASARSFQFRDAAPALGMNFQYVNGSRPETAGEYMYEFSGSGVGALDYDGDGWPDLYWTQGSDWPPREAQRQHLDRLYRNQMGEHFDDVTAESGILESCFSQGLAIGDIDNDGFCDLYVGNLGRNRLFRNNGDGTFHDVTESSGTAGGETWTTSCAIADVNGDGLPDIYVVNYVHGAGMFEHPCLLPDGSPRLCTPHEFAATDDELYLNLGDGRFREISREAGLRVPEGKGLGLVVADFDANGQLDVFVANDSVPNFLFVNRTAAATGLPHFEERGYASGVAVNGDGQPLASMGVAAGDADGDGRLDLFVTTFRLEPKTLFLQQWDLLFVDGTRQAGLHEAGFNLLGFGAQFIDADLDGLPDLVVANGHVGNLSQHGIPYEMPAQLFHNVGAGRFADVPPARLGPFFAGTYLGRGLARLDWNRDGREDFALSQLEQPVALVSNETADTGHFLAVQFRGVQSSRDAIGTRVSLTAGGRRWEQQLAAGDGYLASNQRQLVFGLGALEVIDELDVHWPSGTTQIFSQVHADQEIILIEGLSAAARVAR